MLHVATPALSVPETREECGGTAVRNFCSTGRVYFLRCIPRDFYKYEEIRLAHAFARSIVPECIRAESLPEVVMLRFVSNPGVRREAQSAMCL